MKKHVVFDRYKSIRNHKVHQFYISENIKEAFENTKLMLKLVGFSIFKIYDDDGTFTITFFVEKGSKNYLEVNFWFPLKNEKYTLGWIDIYRFWDKDGNRLFETDDYGEPINGSEIYHTVYKKIAEIEEFIKQIPNYI